MEKIKTFFHIFINSIIPNDKYYHKILRVKFSLSLKYLISLVVILNILFVSFYSIKLNPIFITSVLNNLNNSLDKFPKELVITKNQKGLNTTYNRPYFLWLDVKNKTNLLLAIDEKATPEKIKEYSSCLLITSKEIVMKNKLTGNISEYSLEKVQDQKITKSTIAGIQNIINTVIAYLPLLFILIVALALIILVFTSFIIFFIYSLISSTILFFLFKYLFKKRPHYKKALQISFHAITLPLIIGYILIMLNVGGQVLPYSFFFLVLVFIGAGIYEAQYEKK